MKKITFFLLLLAAGVASMAAATYEYTPLVREGVEWKYRVVNTCRENAEGNGSLQFTHKMQLKGDTLIAGKSYKKCYVYLNCLLDPYKESPVAYLREDGKKVYAVFKLNANKHHYATNGGTVNNDLSAELLLYDFNISKAGEKIAGSVLSFPNEYCTVQKVDSIEIGGKLRKRMHLGPCIQGEATIPIHTVIEGIGNVFYDDFLNPCPMITTCQCIRDVNLQYIANLTTKSIEYSPNSVVTMDDCTHEGVAQVSGEGGISVSQSGNSLMVAIGASGMHTIDVLSAAGSVVASRYTITASTIAIPTAGWTPGVYIVSIASPTHRFTQKILKK